MRPTKSQSWFTQFAKGTARVTGRPTTFLMAIAIILTWIVTGPLFDYSDTWQLAINTGTTIITFLMVFLIQSTQNRDSEAVQVKLDELLRATAGAHNALLDYAAFQYTPEFAASGIEVAPITLPLSSRIHEFPELPRPPSGRSLRRPRRSLSMPLFASPPISSRTASTCTVASPAPRRRRRSPTSCAWARQRAAHAPRP